MVPVEEEDQWITEVSWEINEVCLMIEACHLQPERAWSRAVTMVASNYLSEERDLALRSCAMSEGETKTPMFMMTSMKIVTWNCRGAGNERFRRAFDDMF